MSDLVRKQYYIYQTQDALLKCRAKEQKVIEAELVRQAIARQIEAATYRVRGRDSAAWEEEMEFIRQWMAKGPVKGQRSWQREELHER